MSKSLPWFRLHADILSDEKVLCLAVSDRWYFVAVLALKCSGVIDKYQEPELSRKVAAKLGIDNFETQELKRRLLDEELIDEKWQPTAWDARQYVTDAGAAERMRAYRQRKKAKENNDAALRNALRPREQNTDTELSSLRSDKSARRGSRLSEDWYPSEQDTAFAAGEGLSFDAVEREIERFRDYWIAQPGQKGVKLDWSATWRNWIRRATEQRKTVTSGKHRNHDIIEGFAEIARSAGQ